LWTRTWLCTRSSITTTSTSTSVATTATFAITVTVTASVSATAVSAASGAATRATAESGRLFKCVRCGEQHLSGWWPERRQQQVWLCRRLLFIRNGLQRLRESPPSSPASSERPRLGASASLASIRMAPSHAAVRRRAKYAGTHASSRGQGDGLPATSPSEVARVREQFLIADCRVFRRVGHHAPCGDWRLGALR